MGHKCKISGPFSAMVESRAVEEKRPELGCRLKDTLELLQGSYSSYSFHT